MAQSITVVMTDDIDGSEATETVAFALDGVWYEIDLNPGNAEKLRESFTEWIEAGRRSGAAPARRSSGDGGADRVRRSPRDSNPENARIRAWARSHGVEVNEHGRVPAHIRQLYENMSLSNSEE